jgi:hypothetical protein
VAFSQNTDADTGRVGVAGVQGALHYERYGVPDMDVYMSRFEGRYIWSGPRRVLETTFFG